jgi:hypothetical protein
LQQKSKDAESILAFLNRYGLLERVLGSAEGLERKRYANRLILDSDRLLSESPKDEEFACLRSIAERDFARTHSWVHAFSDDAQGAARDWERRRATELGRTFTRYFPDIEEGLPLYLKTANGYRVATQVDDAYKAMLEILRGEWFEFAIYEEPPAWSEALHIRRSALDLHQKFFGAYWDWDSTERVASARTLRRAAFEAALARNEASGKGEKVLGKWLKPVVNLWPQVRDILELTGMQAILFTEEVFARLDLTLYLEYEDTGFWVPHPYGKTAAGHLSDMGCSDYAHAFANGTRAVGTVDGWDDFRVTQQDFDTVLAEARRVATNSAIDRRGQELAAECTSPDYLDHHHPNFSPKLAAAIAAWQAVTAQSHLLSATTVKGAMKAWLHRNAAALGLLKADGSENKQAIEDIAKVANWNPEGGAPETPRKVR